MVINAQGLPYRDLNEQIHRAVANGEKEIILNNINGQRYIGDALTGPVKIVINGVPGNDLSAFMDGPTIIVNSNGQDGIGNTMNAGQVVVHGSVGDIAGHSLRGGKIFIRGNAGYRVGIHMKAYQELYPVIIIGETAGDFLGEYMAGGLIIVLGLKNETPLVGNYVGTGMHGGMMFIRGKVEPYQLGKEVNISSLSKEDRLLLERYIQEYCQEFSLDPGPVLNSDFVKIAPFTHRPYGKLYAY